MIPIRALATALLTRGLYLDHWKVALGIYNRRISERVTELNSTCRPPDTTAPNTME